MNDKSLDTDQTDKIENKNIESTNSSDQSNSTIDINNTAPVSSNTKKKFRFKTPIIIILIILAIIGAFIVSDYYTNKKNSIELCKKAEDLAKDRYPDFKIIGTTYNRAEHGMDSSYVAYCTAHIVKKSGNKLETWVYSDTSIGYNSESDPSNNVFTLRDVYDKHINYGNFSDEAKNNLISIANKNTGDKNIAYAYTPPDSVVLYRFSKGYHNSIEKQAVIKDMSENKNRKIENYFYIYHRAYYIYYLDGDNWVFVGKVLEPSA